MRVRTLTAIAATTLALTSACGGGAETKETSGNGAPKAEQSSEIDGGDVDDFFEALAEGDSEALEKAKNLTAPDSLAAAYLDYLIQAADVEIDSGYETFVETEYKKEGGTYQSCPVDDVTEDPCTTFRDIETEGGKIADFKVSDVAIGDKLTKGDGSKVKAGKIAEVEFLTGYTTSAGNLIIIYRVESKGEDISLGMYEATYRDPTGRQSTATSDSSGPDNLAADSSATVMSIFPKAKAGGEITVPIYDADYDEMTAKLKTK